MVASKLVALCALFAGAALAQDFDVEYNQRVASPDQFWKRGSSSFKAPEDTKAGSTCDAAFGAGYITCRDKSATEIRLCYNPSIGQVCCQNEWGCPADSYCLTKGLCCPSGVDSAACAGAYSVPLPSTLKTSDSGPPQTTPPPPPPSTTWTSTIITSTPVTTYNSTPSVNVAAYTSCPLSTAPHVITSAVYVTPIPMYNSTTLGTASTGYVVPPTTTGKVPVYTGAASSNTQFGAWTGLAALVAVAGLL